MGIKELKELQDKIIRKDKKCNMIGTIIILIIIICTIALILSSKFQYKYFAFIAILFEIIIGLIIVTIIKNIVNSKDITKFEKEYKNIFVLGSLKKIFDGLEYKPENGISEETIDKIGMMNTGDRFSSNDYISGVYKNIHFEQSDIEIEEKHEEKDDDGNTKTTWETIFCGRWMIFDFNKKFKANMVVSSIDFNGDYVPLSKDYSQVKMEDVNFNKEFSVWTNLEHDAFYILTPHFMEKIKDIYKKLDCAIMLCFVDNKLHVAIDNLEDSFEYNVLEPIDEDKINDGITKDIKLITDLVDELNLDNDLFKEK